LFHASVMCRQILTCDLVQNQRLSIWLVTTRTTLCRDRRLLGVNINSQAFAVTINSCVFFGNFLWLRCDQRTIDAFGPNGLSGLVLKSSSGLSKLQTGYVYHYAFAMMIGVVILLSWYFSGFGR